MDKQGHQEEARTGAVGGGQGRLVVRGRPRREGLLCYEIEGGRVGHNKDLLVLKWMKKPNPNKTLGDRDPKVGYPEVRMKMALTCMVHAPTHPPPTQMDSLQVLRSTIYQTLK